MSASNQQDTSCVQSSNEVLPGSPQYLLDQMSISASMDANKEALGRKLQLRRSVNELVDQGIYPALPAAFAVKGRQLQIAQIGDKLKHSLHARPDRNYLVQHHILEDSNVDPSLQSTQRKLKKAKLSDELNEKIANRPGPLELVEQCILEAEDPIRHAIKEGKIEFHKAQDGIEGTVQKLPYEVDSPKSGTSSPEPIDCDTDSNASSAGSTGFNIVPAPPDITPLLKQANIHTTSVHSDTITINNQTFTSSTVTAVALSPYQFPCPTGILTHQQQKTCGFGAQRINRKSSKQTRPKQQAKQRIIKFHEYKGPTISKNHTTHNTSSTNGTFITSTGPIQKLDGLTPYQLRVHQQQLYLQCQLEVQNKGSVPTVLFPLHAAPIVKLDHQELSPPRQTDMSKSRPVTPAIKSPPASFSNPPTPLSSNRTLTNLEDMKVTDLKMELKQRNLPVSGSKPQLIERLRCHQQQQQQELAGGVPSVGSLSDISSYSNLSSVQSFSDESFIAPASVASTIGRYNSPPTSPPDDFVKPSSVNSRHQEMEIDDSCQSLKSTADIVREQAKKIEELQRALIHSQQQLQLVQHPYVVTQTVPNQTEYKSIQPAQQNNPLKSSPVDITDKQVYLATPDGKMTAYKVVLHTGNGLIQNVISKNDSGSTSSNIQVPDVVVLSPKNVVKEETQSKEEVLQSKIEMTENNEMADDVDEILEVLIRTGANCNQNSYLGSSTAHNNIDPLNMPPLNSQNGDVNLQSFADMEWMDDGGSTFLPNFDGAHRPSDQSNAFDNCTFDWLSDVVSLDTEPVSGISNNSSQQTYNTYSNGDPVLTPKANDVLNIFNIDDTDFHIPNESALNFNWDKLIGQTSHNF